MGSDFVGELWQRARVAVGEQADASGEGLGNAVEFFLHSGGEGGEPLVVHDKGFDFVFAAVFFGDFLQFLFHGGDFGFQGVDGGLVLGIVAGDDEGERDQLGGVFLFTDGEVGLGFCFAIASALR